ncbi:hypothetical protein [Metapseudomonas otitidis]|uniref:hypothetical protein n=1 Tax=Metapseudomonas otitidis TaxID=319939 RepID=UPI00197E1140|nr:hypothetical protein [Pseudomonas otitidis]
MRRSVRIADIIDDSPISGLQVRVLVFCFLIVLLDGFDTAVIGYVAPELIGDWGLVREQLAPAFGAGLFGMLVGAVCCGPLADRFGRKRVLLGAVRRPGRVHRRVDAGGLAVRLGGQPAGVLPVNCRAGAGGQPGARGDGLASRGGIGNGATLMCCASPLGTVAIGPAG